MDNAKSIEVRVTDINSMDVFMTCVEAVKDDKGQITYNTTNIKISRGDIQRLNRL
jgi:hypothetical protein